MSSSAAQALLKVLQVSRQDYRSCPAAFHHAGSEPDSAAIDQASQLIVRAWRAAGHSSIGVHILKMNEDLFRLSLSRFLESNSSKDRSNFIDLFKNALALSDQDCKAECYFRLLLSTFITTLSARFTNESGKRGFCICSISLAISNLERITLVIEQITPSASIAAFLNSITTKEITVIKSGNFRAGRVLEPRLTTLAEEISNLTGTYFSSRPRHPFLQFNELMIWLGAARIIFWSNFHLFGGKRGESIESQYYIDLGSRLPFNELILFIGSIGNDGNVITLASLEGLKLQADVFAAAKNYTKAIELYSIVGELAPNVNAKVNCAALRLRIAKDTDTLQFQLVIMDCTFALELEPDHVKALFRRGLAFCKLKMWNEGIVDFERTIELDSRSPAVKELAIARRQVMRRLGA